MLQVKSIEAIAITFPLLVVVTCGVRKLMDYVFTQDELFWLDQLLPSATDKHSESHVETCDSLLDSFELRQEACPDPQAKHELILECNVKD